MDHIEIERTDEYFIIRTDYPGELLEMFVKGFIEHELK